MVTTKSKEPAPKSAGGTRLKTPSRGLKHPIHELHETLGNQAVKRLYKSGLLQAKLGLSNPGDRFEREADRVADQVMHLPQPIVQMKPG